MVFHHLHLCRLVGALMFAHVLLSILICVSGDSNTQSRDEGVRMLHQGNIKGAIEHLQQAVDNDPTDYLANFNLAIAYFAMQNMQRAKELFKKTIELRNDFTDSLYHLVSVYIKQGLYDDASKYLNDLIKTETEKSKIAAYREKQKNINNLKAKLKVAQSQRDKGDIDGAEKTFTELIQHSDCSSFMYENRSIIYEKQGKHVNAIDDLKQVLRLSPYGIERATLTFKIARLHIFEGMLGEAIKWIRECLRIDTANEQCHPLFWKLKRLDQKVSKIEQAIQKSEFQQCVQLCNETAFADSDISISDAVQSILQSFTCRCALHASDDQSEVVSLCTRAMEMSLRVDPEIIKSRAEAYLNLRNWDDAMKDYRKLKESGYSEMAEEGFKRITQMKNRNDDDYYELLGVSRTATTQQINRAFRKKAKLHHPDGKNTPKEKEEAEKIFKRLVSAKDVLTDKEKRERYDNGEDPNGPSMSGQAYDSFNSFHFPGGDDHFFGGSGFTFRFVYQ